MENLGIITEAFAQSEDRGLVGARRTYQEADVRRQETEENRSVFQRSFSGGGADGN
jgi:hypothetical protein